MQDIDISNLSLAQKIYLLEELWNSIKNEKKSIESPTWHKDILNKRKESYKKGEAILYSIDDIKKRLL